MVSRRLIPNGAPNGWHGVTDYLKLQRDNDIAALKRCQASATPFVVTDAASDARRLDPMVNIVTPPTSMAIAQPDVMWPWGFDSSFPLRRPVVQRPHRHAGQVVNLFGRQHLVAVSTAVCHRHSPEVGGRIPASGSLFWRGGVPTLSGYPQPPVHNFLAAPLTLEGQ